ncbi:MAG: site-specific DNA-methyltransferase, partial [Neisseriaceae bacterium]|nr:site-specific DNA-methyltransferase [Neisseriaceae bacterium]
YYLENRTKRPSDLWTNLDGNKKASIELKEIFGTRIFDTPKPLDLIERILSISTDKNAIVLDSFSGSGTTAHAVLSLNQQDGGHRRFIAIEMMDYAETITAERIRRVMNGYGTKAETQNGTGGGFAFYSVGVPLFVDEYHLNPDAPLTAIREYIAYTEGLDNVWQPENGVSPHALGLQNNTALVFFYVENQVTTLDLLFLQSLSAKGLPEKPEQWVIYADKCALSDEQLKQYHIVFKRIPRDISKF